MDRRLYGVVFFYRSLPFVVIGLVVQSYVFALFFPQLLLVYVTVYITLLVFSGLLAKNSGREFHAMDWSLAYIFLTTSILGLGFAFSANFEITPLGFLQAFLVVIVPETALLLSSIIITVLGQRVSLRYSFGMSDGVFGKARKRWEQELDTFPNLDNILSSLDEGRFVASLFDKGFFNLAILWSCNVMEKIVDATATEIVSQMPDKEPLFRYEGGRRRPYPEQLNNLGYGLQETYKTALWRVWDVRRKIAHYNHRPTFNETAEVLRTLISFAEEMPRILKSWDLQPRSH